MKHLLGILFFMCIGFIQVQSQVTTDKLDYSKYEPGEQRYNFLDWEFAGAASLNDDFGSIRDNVGLSFSQQRYRNTARRQVESRISAGFSSDRNGLGYDLGLDYQSRNYLFKKLPNFYVAADASFQLQGGTSWQMGYGSSLSFGIGMGRVSILNEIDVAERILETLSGSKIDGSTTTSQDVTQLADLITELKNQRYFTNRGEWKSELDVVAAKLRELGYNFGPEELENSIGKIYSREPLVLREQGTLISFKGMSQDSNLPSPWYRTSAALASINLEVDNRHYINSKFQWNSKATATYGQTDVSNYYLGSPDNRGQTTYASLSMKSTLHYLPDMDSRFSLSVFADYNKLINGNYYDYIDGERSRIESYSTLGVGMSLEYEKRVTRNTRIAVGLDVKYTTAFKGKGNFYVGPKMTVKF